MRVQWWLVCCLSWVRGCDRLDSPSSALAGGKDADPTFNSFIWWWERKPHLVGRGIDPTSPLGSSEPDRRFDICLSPTRLDLKQSQWPEGRFIVGLREEGGKRRGGTSQGSSPVGLCWSSAHLVQCKPDEPNWTWTQTWVRARLLDYSLNWPGCPMLVKDVIAHPKVAQPNPGAIRPRICPWPWRAEEEQNPSPGRNPATDSIFSCCLLYSFSDGRCYMTGLSEKAYVHRKFLY